MKNIWPLFKINSATYILILTFLLTGLIKNIILIYLIIIIHELGHIMMIKLLKYDIIKVEIYPMGGVTTIKKDINSKVINDFLIAIMGIIMQIILFFLFIIFFKNNLISLNTFNLFKSYNKTIILFNLIPIIPLDGYHILRSINELFFSFKTSFYLSLIISIISLILFIIKTGIFSLNNYLVISFLIYKIIYEYKNFKFIHLEFLLERLLKDLKFNKIKYNHQVNLDYLKKDTYHYFKTNDKVYSEKEVLNNKFRNNNR